MPGGPLLRRDHHQPAQPGDGLGVAGQRVLGGENGLPTLAPNALVKLAGLRLTLTAWLIGPPAITGRAPTDSWWCRFRAIDMWRSARQPRSTPPIHPATILLTLRQLTPTVMSLTGGPANPEAWIPGSAGRSHGRRRSPNRRARRSYLHFGVPSGPTDDIPKMMSLVVLADQTTVADAKASMGRPGRPRSKHAWCEPWKPYRY